MNYQSDGECGRRAPGRRPRTRRTLGDRLVPPPSDGSPRHDCESERAELCGSFLLARFRGDAAEPAPDYAPQSKYALEICY